MQQIADWLEKLGMSEYADRFTQNRIDLSVLPELTDQHLKDLGIARSRAATAMSMSRLRALRTKRSELANCSLRRVVWGLLGGGEA